MNFNVKTLNKNWTRNKIYSINFFLDSIGKENTILFKMKTETLEMKREVWDYLRRYRRAPFKKRYLEMLEYEGIDKATKIFKKMYS